MRYISTRGALADAPQGFSDSLLGGLAPDGGLTWPVQMPRVTPAELERWRHLSYAELAFAVLSRFTDDIEPAVLETLCEKTYTPQVYCNTRPGEHAADITPLTTLGTEQGAPLSLLALSNGPTLAFKDMAMQLLGNLFEHALAARGEQINILGATSGDTGSAAEYALRGKRGVRVFMLSPHGRMSPFQQAQMFSLQDANVFNIAMHGVFDDCQDVVKRVNEDLAFKKQYRIGAVNSINFARVVAQAVYYFRGWFAATAAGAGEVSFAVPSGNFGNVLAGHIARRMGLPIRKLVVATNENRVLDEFFRTGVYRVRKSAETLETSSPSMDISKASNFERFVFDLVGGDAARVRELFAQVERGGFDLSADPAFQRIAEYGLVSGCSSHSHRLAVIRDVAGRYGEVIDPHTADGVKVAREYLEPGVPMVVLETAQPVKFASTIEAALDRAAPRPAAFEGIEQRPKRFEVMNADVAAVKDYIARHVG
ncbi:MAG TPA: threonine synthase [Burkholderiaceae bacterium]|nr:threonine synthase [Burkholderiaceae bacterium]